MKVIQYSTGQWWIAIFALWVLLIGPGNIEGRLFPAASPMTLTKANLSDDGKTALFWGESSRLRPECNFRDIKWYIGKRGDRDAPVKITTGPPKVRANGKFSFGPWSVGIQNVAEFKENSYSDVYHQCSLFGWQMQYWVRSPFWN